MIPNLRVPKHIMPLSDDELFALCASNSELLIERNANGELIIMSPTGGLTGNRSSRILIELGKWNDRSQLGYVFDSSTGFILPDTSMLAPDASWVSKEKWERLTTEQKEKFPPLCPEFVVELSSPSDDHAYVQKKMKTWMKNGCRLAWLIEPNQSRAYVFTSHDNFTEHTFDESLSGNPVLPGFSLPLKLLR